MKRLYILCLLMLLSGASSLAQSPRFYLGFDGIFDNREYFTPYSIHQTIFGARINPGVAFQWDTVHQLHVGLNYMYEFGGELLGVLPQIDLYYSYHGEHLKFLFGSFPRRELLDEPLMILTDSLGYYRPNLEGAWIGTRWDWGSVQGWVDWTGRETPETRESILGGASATIRSSLLYLTAGATWYHLAKTTADDDTHHIMDEGSVKVMAGADLSDRTVLDRLKLTTGWVATHARTRPAPTAWFHGWLSLLEVQYRIGGIKGSYYLGDPSPLSYGDRLYGSGNYGRLDLFIEPFSTERISARVSWNLHLLPGDGLYHSQQILIQVSL